MYDIKKLEKLTHSINKVLIGIWMLCLSPMILIALCVTRVFEMNIINAVGVSWILLCVLVSIPLLIFGNVDIYTYYKDTKTNLDIYMSNVEYVEKWCEKNKNTSIYDIVSGIFLIILSLLPVITISMLRLSNSTYTAYSYVAVFILSGGGVGILVRAGLKIFVTLRLKYNVIKEENNKIVNDKEKPKRSEKFKWGKRIIIPIIIIGIIVGIMSKGTWYIQPYIATVPKVKHRQLDIDYNTKSGVYTIHNNENSEFKILQLTDIHIGGSLFSYAKDIKALEAVYKLINYTKPDLVVVTGDFVFPVGIESYSFNNYTPIMQFASFMRNIGIPWAFTYGNHDTEFIASHSEEELNSLFEIFSYESTGSLLYTTVQPDVTGRSNQVIVIENSVGTLNQVLYLIDSNSYKSMQLNDYDNIHDDQVRWYQNSLEQMRKQYNSDISSLIFTHMPLNEYKTAYSLYKLGNSEVTYCFGKIGENNEAICCSEKKSKLFDVAVEEQSTKGIFVGHDHYNTISLKYKNIQLTYGMSIDYLAMPGISKKTEQRGGTLITLNEDTSIQVVQVPLTDIPE